MKIIVFGASGTIGRQLVRQALADGHTVTAFARDLSVLAADPHPGLTLRPGDVLDPSAVAAAVPGHDAVIVALGAGAQGTVRAAGTRHVVDAMRRHGVRRLIGLSTLGAGDSRVHLNFFWKRIMFGLLLRRAMADHEDQEAAIRDSGLDWTIVRPGGFTDDPAPNIPWHGVAAADRKLALKVSRRDVAAFMLGQLDSDRYLHRAPALSW